MRRRLIGEDILVTVGVGQDSSQTQLHIARQKALLLLLAAIRNKKRLASSQFLSHHSSPLPEHLAGTDAVGYP